MTKRYAIMTCLCSLLAVVGPSLSTSGAPKIAKQFGSEARIDLEGPHALLPRPSMDAPRGNTQIVPQNRALAALQSDRMGRGMLAVPDDVFWANGFGRVGLPDRALAMAVYNSNLIVGGEFTTAGGVAANGIASWDGTSWSALGSGVGEVYALAIYDGKLIVAQYDGVVAWDGTSWTSLGQEMGGYVRALAIFDGKLIAAGSFHFLTGRVYAENIASWDGASWSRLGHGITDDHGSVEALAVYDGKLIAGGSFSTADSGTVNNIASWDGTSWSPLGSGISGNNPIVYALAAYDSKLFAGGYFTSAGGVVANHIASWDGTSWSPLASGMSSVVYSLAAYNDKLIAGGFFTTAGGVSASRIASWNGTSWSPLGSGISGNYPTVYALAAYDGKLFAGGDFFAAGGVTANDIASWDGNGWSGLGSSGSGMDWPVLALALYHDKLIAGGDFRTVGGDTVNAIASWDGTSWSPLGSGLDAGVFTLAVYNDKLVAAGYFGAIADGGDSLFSIGSWDGTSWSSLGLGFRGNWPLVYALTVYDGKLIAAGHFLQAGGVEAIYIASWDGTSWSPLRSHPGSWVSCLAVYDGKLIAGGHFAMAGTSKIASWDGTSWSPLGSGISSEYGTGVNALAVYNGKLIAGGDFTTAGGVSANHIASWDGSSWSALGSGMSSGYDEGVFALAVYNGKLIAGGGFTTAGGVSASNIASWDGASWSALGSGTSGEVYALSPYNDGLVVGGNFKVTGDKSSANIGIWTRHDLPIIKSIQDVPSDQGGKIGILWGRSGFDLMPEAEITQYSVWRRLSASAVSSKNQGLSMGAMPIISKDSKGPKLRLANNGWVWEWIATLPACQNSTYADTVLSLYDSIGADPHWQYFMVTAHTSVPSVYYDSPIDSGYSVDNLSPSVPGGLVGEQSYEPVGLKMSWEGNKEADLHHYAVYRGTSEDFVPAPGNLLASPVKATWFDAEWRWDRGYCYKVSAVDVHGNESRYAVLTAGNVTGAETPKVPAVTYLAQNYPNPFNPVTKIEFGLREAGPVSLRIYDVAGQLVRILVDEPRPAGVYAKVWDGRGNGGSLVASGVYFYRLKAGSFVETKKMILMR